MIIGTLATTTQHSQSNTSSSSIQSDKIDFLNIISELENEFRESPFIDKEKKEELEEIKKEIKALENSLKSGNINNEA